ncbi:MAG: TIGR03905 family TSCPD domain-containing protein [Oscillospiraceae bacterium]
MTTIFRPQGVCSRLMEIETEGDVICGLHITGGCSGNLQGISRLVEGMTIEETIKKLRGIRCGFKKTSCPDQLAIALETILKDEKNS